VKAILQNGGTVDLGPDTIAAVHRAGRLYKKGVFTKIIIEIPVPKSGWSSSSPIGGYWTLLEAGFLSRDEQLLTFSWEYEGSDITYTVIADVEFTDAWGNHWKQGDVEEWPK